MKRKIDLIINLLTNSKTYIQNNKSATELLPTFPILTLDDFTKFETSLQTDRQIRQQFVSIFLSLWMYIFSIFQNTLYITLFA